LALRDIGVARGRLAPESRTSSRFALQAISWAGRREVVDGGWATDREALSNIPPGGIRVDRIALFSDFIGRYWRRGPRAGETTETSPMSKRLRILAACAALAGLGACAAPPPPAPVITAPPPKPLDAKTQLENHS
jgi:hypothetical protein